MPKNELTTLRRIGCLGRDVAGFNIPSNQQTTKTGEEVVADVSGTIVNARGHMHDGGVQLSMIQNGNPVCVSEAVYGGAESTFIGRDGTKWETINSMTECTHAIRIQKGDKIKLEAVYDTKKHPA
jgi:hypothetical protein